MTAFLICACVCLFAILILVRVVIHDTKKSGPILPPTVECSDDEPYPRQWE